MLYVDEDKPFPRDIRLYEGPSVHPATVDAMLPAGGRAQTLIYEHASYRAGCRAPCRVPRGVFKGPSVAGPTRVSHLGTVRGGGGGLSHPRGATAVRDTKIQTALEFVVTSGAGRESVSLPPQVNVPTLLLRMGPIRGHSANTFTCGVLPKAHAWW